MPRATTSPVGVMKNSHVVAVVGASKNPEKEANSVPLFLRDHGYRIIPVNPTAPEILGEKAYADLLSIPPELAKQVDVIEVFRPSEELPTVARVAAEFSQKNGTKPIFWAQLGLENEEAKRILSDAGLNYVMNACMRVAYKTAQTT